jgi:hypothetical protein
MAASARRLSADGATPLAQFTWPTTLSDVTEEITGPLKFAIENDGTRALGDTSVTGLTLVLRLEQVGGNDGILYYQTALDPNGTASRPFGVEAEVQADAASGFTPDTYGYVVTATTPDGQTPPSDEVTAEIVETTDGAVVSWSEVPNAAGYKVYRTPTPGTYGATTLVATIGSGATVTFTDTGVTAASGTPPAVNTTGGAGPAYGDEPDPGDFDDEDKLIDTLEIGQQWFYWARLRVPAATGSNGNRRTLRIVPKEIT